MARPRALSRIKRLISYGKFDQASRECRKYLDQEENPEAIFLLAVISSEKELFAEALTLFEKAKMLSPERADVAYNFGNLLQKINRLDQAIVEWERAVEIEPGHVDALINLGKAWYQNNKVENSLAAYEEAAARNPENVDALFGLGNINYRLGRYQHAAYCFSQITKIKPEHISAQANLGLCQLRTGENSLSIDSFSKVIFAQPDNIIAHVNRSFALLANGCFEEGWAEAEWRRKALSFELNHSKEPNWSGEDISGKNLLLFSEQGHGDTIQYLRYIRALDKYSATIQFVCHESLVSLARNIDGISSVRGFNEQPEPFDLYAPLMSLPHILKISDPVEYSTCPYIHAPNPFRLPGTTAKKKVGLVWAGNFAHDNDKARSTTLDALSPLLKLPDIDFFSLQVGPEEDTLSNSPYRDKIYNMAPQLFDYSMTARVIEALDLVITVDTSVGHLSGALGKPTWMMLPLVSDWRWFQDTDSTPWYQSMTLFRQESQSDWEPVVQSICIELKARP